MKKLFYCLGASALLLQLAACGQKKEAEVELNSRGVPLTVADLILGDQYRIDTLYSSEEQTYVAISNATYIQNLIYDNNGSVLLNSPTVFLDTLGSHRYRVNDVMNTIVVNFADPKSVAELKALYPTYGGFSQEAVCDTSTYSQKAVFSYVVDVPEDSNQHSGDIKKWLLDCTMDSLTEDTGFKELGEALEQSYFNGYRKFEMPYPYMNARSLLVYFKNDRYLTYQDYFYGYSGGAHGIYANRFVSYDMAANKPVTYEELIMPDCEQHIRELIYEALAADNEFMTANKLTSLSQVKTCVKEYMQNDTLPIPDPGVLRDGVVFCYQPYDIAPYAAGAFQLVVPWSKINEYLLRKNP